MCHKQMNLMSNITRVTIEVEELLQPTRTISYFLTQLYICLSSYAIRSRVSDFSTGQCKLPGTRAQIILFNQHNMLFLTYREHQDTFRALDNIPFNLITIWRMPPILIHGQHLPLIHCPFGSSQLPPGDTVSRPGTR